MTYPTISELGIISRLALNYSSHKLRMLSYGAEAIEKKWLYRILNVMDEHGPMTAQEISETCGFVLQPLMLVLKNQIRSGTIVKSYNMEKMSTVYTSTSWLKYEQHSEFMDIAIAMKSCIDETITRYFAGRLIDTSSSVDVECFSRVSTVEVRPLEQ